jgi:hypothetical protein
MPNKKLYTIAKNTIGYRKDEGFSQARLSKEA